MSDSKRSSSSATTSALCCLSCAANVWFLVETAARQLHASAGPAAAIDFCRDFAKESEVCRECLTQLAASIEGQQRRQHLVGSPIELTGATAEGNPFDWTPLAGKTVLVDFWFTGCAPCRQDLPWLKQLHETPRDDQFAIVGVSVDTDSSELATFPLAQEKIPWPTIHDLAKKPESNAVRYNVLSFPTYFLVDRTGKVVYAGKHSDELEKLLADALRQ